MISKGKWIGHYNYDNKRLEKVRGIQHTNFEIDILSVDQNLFSGTVQDDQATKGTPGIGEISGEVNDKEIKFIKQMPVRTMLVADGSRRTANKPHPKIYYTGLLSEDGRSASGKWKIKAGFSLIGLLLVIAKTTTGTWTMKLKD